MISDDEAAEPLVQYEELMDESEEEMDESEEEIDESKENETNEINPEPSEEVNQTA